MLPHHTPVMEHNSSIGWWCFLHLAPWPCSTTPEPPRLPLLPTSFHLELHCSALLQEAPPWNASRSLSSLIPCLPPCSLHLLRSFFLHSLMDLALFSFCLPLEPWNSPSGEKAIFPDASLHFMNIVRSFHPLFLVPLLSSCGLYIVVIVSLAH